MDDEVCVICMDATDDAAVLLPGCGHRFHVACLLTSCQYDVRCPVCRAVPAGVQTREKEVPLLVIWEEDAQEERQNRARVLARRRTVFRRHPSLKRLDQRLRQRHRDLRAEEDRLQRAFLRACRNAWKWEPDLLQQRDQVRRLRRRARDTELQLERRLTSLGCE